MPKETILVIEDDPKIRMHCHEILTSKDYQVIAIRDCEAAIKIALEAPVDLYLIDIEMPGVNGLDLLERIKGIHPEVLAIIITGRLTNENLLRALHLGVKCFMVKPFRDEDLLDSLKKILEDDRLLKARIQSHVLNPLFEISESFLSEIDLGDILKRIVELARQETHADLVTLMLMDPKSYGFNTAITIGGIQGELEAEIKKIQSQLAEWVTTHKEPLVIVEGLDAHEWIQKVTAEQGISSSIGLPLLRKDKVIGVLHMCKKEGTPSFTQNDLELATVLCRQAAVLIDNVRLFDEVNRKARDLEEAQFDAIKALAEALETKDAYTRDHSDRALLHAVAVAEKMGLSDLHKERLKYAAILHDIGKIGVPEQILNKPAKLTEEEYEIMKTHPEKGAEIIKHIKSLAAVVPLVLYHQERYDGKGYPTGLAGDKIPIESRIVSVLDAFDAMTSDRVYRASPGRKFAVEELKRFAGTQFDPDVVQAFLDVIGEAGGLNQGNQYRPNDPEKTAHQALPNVPFVKH
jgi:response regulator RpfG family c-di-GMP phosphodiesterase